MEHFPFLDKLEGLAVPLLKPLLFQDLFYVQLWCGGREGERRAVVRLLIWVLGIKLGSSGKAGTLNQPQPFSIYFLCV